jgi:hypothetical protein
MFVDCPSELIIELPSDEGHQNAPDSHDTGNDDQEWLRLPPNLGLDKILFVELVDCGVDLLNLDRSIDQQSHVTHAKTDDLDGVLHAQCIIDQHELVDETETVKGEEGGDCSGGGNVVGPFLDLKVGKYITKKGKKEIVSLLGSLTASRFSGSRHRTYHSRASVTSV